MCVCNVCEYIFILNHLGGDNNVPRFLITCAFPKNTNII